MFNSEADRKEAQKASLIAQAKAENMVIACASKTGNEVKASSIRWWADQFQKQGRRPVTRKATDAKTRRESKSKIKLVAVFVSK